MSQKTKDEKPSGSKFGGCCPASSSAAITPDNSITEYSAEDDELANNNNIFHSVDTNDASDEHLAMVNDVDAAKFTFPKRPKVDMEFQNLRYNVNTFSFSKMKFGK